MAPQFIPVVASNAPAPLPQFSSAVTHNGLVYCSGNIGVKPGSDFVFAEGTVKDRAVSIALNGVEISIDIKRQIQALSNIKNILDAAGSSIENVIKMNIYLTNMDNFVLLNEAYDMFFTQDIKPARTCVAVYQLPLGTDVEIECTAHLK